LEVEREREKEKNGKAHIIPERHDQDPIAAKGFVHLRPAADFIESIAVVKCLELVLAEFFIEPIAGNTLDSGLGHIDLLAVLDEELVDFALLELGDDAMKANSVFQLFFLGP